MVCSWFVGKMLNLLDRFVEGRVQSTSTSMEYFGLDDGPVINLFYVALEGDEFEVTYKIIRCVDLLFDLAILRLLNLIALVSSLCFASPKMMLIC